jgi:acyl-coenzyme A thioesterase PaaI-like protein
MASGADRPARPHQPDFAGCYGCAPNQPVGLMMRTVDTDTGGDVMEFTPRPAHQGSAGVTHGGVLAAAMDEAIGVAIWRLGGAYVTARLETDYLRPVPIGTTLLIRTRCTGVHGRKVYAEAEAVLGMDGPVAVRAAALYVEMAGDRPTGPEKPAATGA